MLNHLKALIPHRHPIRLFWHKLKSFLAALRYRFPARHVTVIGVTGTDGKTTTVAMIAHILRETGHDVGAATTAFLRINDEYRPTGSHLTSIDPFALQKFLRELVTKKVPYAVIEYSSHGLVQGRGDYTWPHVACITNIAQEHLDYHGTMKQYIADKGLLFTMLRGKGIKVLNKVDETYDTYNAISTKETLVFNHPDFDLWLSNPRAATSSVSATLHHRGGITTPLELKVPGIFNLENAQCAVAASIAVGVPLQEATSALQSFTGVPGRMERIDEGQDFSVYVDFSVSPQSYERVLQTLRSIVGNTGRVLVMCSSCGNRMQEKRPVIGKICSELADVVVATEDETYGEDPHKVLEEVWAGIDQSTCEAHKIFDRRDAITFLFNQAKPGDAVVLCGMGPFTTMNKLEGEVEWDERAVAREVLGRMMNEKGE